MLYTDASILLTQGMKTLEELITEALEKAHMTPTELGVKMGYKNGYDGYHKLFVSRRTDFSEPRQRQVEEILALPRGHFQAPDLTEKRELYIKRTFQEFLQTDIAKDLDAEALRTIERMSFTGDKLPTVLLYQSIALAMKGHYSVRQIDSALALNEEIDRDPEPIRPAKLRKHGARGQRK
jgi:hypothetical protein